jgi:hypothetical protein
MAYLARDGGRGLRSVIWNRLQALLQLYDSSVIMRAVVDGDIAGSQQDTVTIVVSTDYDFGIIGSLLPSVDALLLCVTSVSDSTVRCYDGARTFIELVSKLFPKVS